MMRRWIIGLCTVALLQLQGCSTSLETFGLGAAIGAVAGVTALTCSIACP
jgi:hypothetical protein